MTACQPTDIGWQARSLFPSLYHPSFPFLSSSLLFSSLLLSAAIRPVLGYSLL
jgi:hypothetical protein